MTELKLRKATLEDINLVYNWANDPDTRANSFSSRIITYEEHSIWYKNILAGNNTFLYIMSDKNNDIGQVRINLENNFAKISFSIDKKYRSNGYGNKIITLIINKIKNDFPAIKKIIAEVKPQNHASRKVFMNNNFAEKFITYELEI